MALKDYNSIAFRNKAIDKMSGKFGNGPGDGVKKASTETNSNALLPNPWSRPPLQAVTAPKVNMPNSNVKLSTASSMPSATSSTTASNYSMPVAKTLKDVKAENKIKKAQARGESAVKRINQRSSMTPEQKTESRQKKASSAGKAIERTFELAGSALGLYGTYKGLKD